MPVFTLILSCIAFWFLEAPLGLIKYFSSLNGAFLSLFSFPILIRTFFKPLKNEYRQGNVEIAIVLGVIIKSVIIAIDLALLIILLVIEIAVVIGLIAWPIITLRLLFM